MHIMKESIGHVPLGERGGQRAGGEERHEDEKGSAGLHDFITEFAVTAMCLERAGSKDLVAARSTDKEGD
jgi:hypothetical protein